MATKPNARKAGPYVPKNILLTGGAGFIGSHVAARITQNYPQYKARHAPCLVCGDRPEEQL